MQDKVINHLVARYILYPAILPCLLDFNVASRKNMGMSYGLKLYKKYRNYYSIRYGTYYILKCDISKFFASIDHDILKDKIKRRLKKREYLYSQGYIKLSSLISSKLCYKALNTKSFCT